jgi:ribosomal protein L37AE/L43A
MFSLDVISAIIFLPINLKKFSIKKLPKKKMNEKEKTFERMDMEDRSHSMMDDEVFKIEAKENTSKKFIIKEMDAPIMEKKEDGGGVIVKRVINNKQESSNPKKKKQRKIKCPHCKKLISSQNRFCTSCGNQLNNGIFDKTSNLGIIINKMENLRIESQFYSHLKPKFFLPHHLTQPSYCVATFAADLKPEEYHGANKIIQCLPEKTAFFLGTTPDNLIAKPVLRQLPPMIAKTQFENFGRRLYNMLKNTESLAMIRVKKNFNLSNFFRSSK